MMQLPHAHILSGGGKQMLQYVSCYTQFGVRGKWTFLVLFFKISCLFPVYLLNIIIKIAPERCLRI